MTIQTQDILVDGVHLRESMIPAGRSITTKARPTNRVYVLADGAVTVDDAGVKTGYRAPAYIQLVANRECEIVTLTDATLYGIDPTPAQSVKQAVDKGFSIEHHFVDGIYAKQMTIDKNSKIPTHKHVYDHLSILAKGRVRVTVNQETVEYSAPAAIEIKRDLVHTLTAMEDSVWFCIHATEATDPKLADKTIIVGRNNVI